MEGCEGFESKHKERKNQGRRTLAPVSTLWSILLCGHRVLCEGMVTQ